MDSLPKKFFFEEKTNIGNIVLVGSEDRLYYIFLSQEKQKRLLEKLKLKQKRTTIIDKTIKQLKLYFEGKLKKFSLNLELTGSEFQKKILKTLYKVSFGKTISYKDLAIKSGFYPSYARAIGSVMRSNPLPIIYPCHRVIGSDASLTGFGGGLKNKQYLIQLEQNFK